MIVTTNVKEFIISFATPVLQSWSVFKQEIWQMMYQMFEFDPEFELAIVK